MTEIAPDNLEIPCLVLANDRQQRGALKFGGDLTHLLLAVPALPEPGDIPSPPAQVGEMGHLFIPSTVDTLSLKVQVRAIAIDHIDLEVQALHVADEQRLRERVKGSPRERQDSSPGINLTDNEKKHLLDEANHYTLSLLQKLFEELFDALVADLQSASLNPKLLQTQQELLFEGMRQVEIVKPRMLELVMGDLQRRLEGNREIKPSPEKKRIDQITQDELDLVDLKEFEESLAVKRLLRMADDLHRGAFELMTIRYAALKGRKPRLNLLPVSLNLLIPSLKRVLNQREIPKELGHRIFEFCGNLLLRKVKTLYANINLFLKQAGLEPDAEGRLESGSPLLPLTHPQPRKHSVAQPTSTAAPEEPDLSAEAAQLPNDDLITLHVAKNKAAFIERLMTSMGNTDDPNTFSDQLVADMFSKINHDPNMNPALGSAIETLRVPMQQIAREDPNFLINNQHPMRLAFNQLTQLARADLYPNPKLQAQVMELIDQVARKQAIDSVSATKLVEQTDAIRQQQQRQFHRNIERLKQVEQGQVRYHEARLATLRVLQEALPGTHIPANLASLISNGWLELLTLHRLRSKNTTAEANALRAEIAVLNNLLQARLRTDEIAPDAITHAIAWLDMIESEISEALPTRVRHVAHLAALRDELSGQRETKLVNVYDTGLFNELSASNLIERLPSLPRLNRLVRRALSIPEGTWFSDAEQERRSYFAWHSERHDHFVFANERGQKTLDFDLLGFARWLYRGQHPIRTVEELPLLDRHLLQKLQEFTPRRVEDTRYYSNTSALAHTSFIEQTILSSQQALHQRQSMHIAAFSATNIGLVGALYDQVIVDAYDETLIQALANDLANDQIIGRLDTGKIGVIFFGESNVSLRKRLTRLSRKLNKLTLATGDESLSLEVQWATLHIDLALTDSLEARQAITSVTEAPAASAISLATLHRDRLSDEGHLRAHFDHSTLALFAFHSHWLTYNTETIDKRIEFRIIDQKTEQDILRPYSVYRSELHSDIDRWRLKTVFAWLRSLTEHEREIPNCVIDVASASISDPTFWDTLLDDISEYGVGTNKLYFRIDLKNAQASVEALQEFSQMLSDIGCRIVGSNVIHADPKCLTSVTCDLLEVNEDAEVITEEQQLRQIDSARLLGCPIVYFSLQEPSVIPESLASSLTAEEILRSSVKPLSQIARELDTLKH